ncbi:hypothetical protein Tco_1158788 [Tanacetum coccineum]
MSSCGSLYTRECCSIGSLENKILVPEPDSSPCCAKCGTPVDGPYCRGCALLRKEFEEDLLTYCVFQDTQETFESSDDNTNMISFVNDVLVSLVGTVLILVIIVHQKPRLSLIQNNAIKPCQSVHPTCNSGDENSFTYDLKPNFADDSPNAFNPPPQPQYVPYSCELCGNDSHYGYDCPPQVPFVYNQDPCFNQNFDYFPQTSPSFPQQYPCCEDCGNPHETFQSQLMNEGYYHE